MPGDGPGQVGFGPYEFDLVRGELRKHGTRVRAQRQPVELLRALLERPGQIVTREELKQRLWPTGLHVEFERSLNRSVNKLGDLLCDNAARPKCANDTYI
jgi:DNA-binding winged helix-turn-helix (wHTH) protein